MPVTIPANRARPPTRTSPTTTRTICRQPGTNPPQALQTDGGNSPAGYPHRLGDIFHSEALVIEPPRYFQYLSMNLAPNGPGSEYLDVRRAATSKRRKVVFVGSNDGFLHAFDAGVWNGDTTNFPGAFDLGSGREIFAYAPRAAFIGRQVPVAARVSRRSPSTSWTAPRCRPTCSSIRSSSAAAGPDSTERVWRTVLVGGLRQGGSGYYALDVTQPDDIETTPALPTYGEMLDPKTNSPACLDGGGSSCTAGPAITNRPYPSVLWEFTDSTRLRTAPTPAPVCCGSGPGRDLVSADPGPHQDHEDRPASGLRGPLRRDLRRRRGPGLLRSGRRSDVDTRRTRLLHRGHRDRKDPLQDRPRT